MSDERAWERLPEETARAYKAFSIYRDMGPQKRSQRETAKCYYEAKNRLNRGQIDRWSVKFNWVQRCKLYDDFIDEQKRQQTLDEILDMATRQAKIGTAMQQLGATLLKGLMENPPKAANTLDVVRLTRTGAEIERLARGVPTQIVEEQGKERDMVVIQWRGEKEEGQGE